MSSPLDSVPFAADVSGESAAASRAMRAFWRERRFDLSETERHMIAGSRARIAHSRRLLASTAGLVTEREPRKR